MEALNTEVHHYYSSKLEANVMLYEIPFSFVY